MLRVVFFVVAVLQIVVEDLFECLFELDLLLLNDLIVIERERPWNACLRRVVHINLSVDLDMYRPS